VGRKGEYLMKKGWVVGALAMLPWTGASAEVAVTVYNQNLGLVTETRRFDVKSGLQHLELVDVAAQMIPTSVRIDFPGGAIDLHEQNYHYDLVNTQAILQRYLDASVRLVGREGAVYEGTLLSAAGEYVLSTPRGLQIIKPGEILYVDLKELPSGFYTRPTLDWLVAAGRAGTVDAVVSYLTNGIGWQAEYVAHLNADDTRLALSGWASIDNQSGATYTDAKLKLIAGDIHRAPRAMYDRGGDMALEAYAAAPKAGFEERAFFEYHLYDLPRRTTLAQREVKQIALFEPAAAAVTKKYLYRSWKDQSKIAVVVEFKNTQANGLGMPLPAGLVRVTKADVDGSTQLLGEDRIDHLPKDEDVTLEVGNAFDVVPEYTVQDRRRISKLVTETDTKVTLRNHKSSRVTVEVEERAPRWGSWTVTSSSHAFEKKDVATFVFKVNVPADGEVEVTYTLRTGP
jgi:hypothetical protein